MSRDLRGRLDRIAGAANALRRCRCGGAALYTTYDPPDPERDEPEPDPKCPTCGGERLVIRWVYQAVPIPCHRD